MTEELGAISAAIEAGESVRGTTSPNPPVGCALVNASGELIATGATSPAGGPHAEINALEQAGERARGATAVVTLEPCNHTGRTGPCSQALVEAGITRVVYFTADPNEAAPAGPSTCAPTVWRWTSSRCGSRRCSRGCARCVTTARA